MALSWFEIIASYMVNLKVKFECSSCGNKLIKSDLQFYNNNIP